MADGERRYGVILCVVIITLSILAGVGIYQFKRANSLSESLENQYTHAFLELTDYVKDVDVLLKKTALVQSPGQLSALSSRIYMQTAAAKANLSLLPASGGALSGTSKFLSQAGDYTSYLSAKVIASNTVTEEEFSTLEKLSAYAGEVSESLEKLEGELYSGKLKFSEKQSSGTAYAADGENMGLERLEEAFQDYPTLIYDGPFSEHIEGMKPLMLESKPNFGQEEARQVAEAFLEGNRSENLNFSDMSKGKMPAYNFISQLGEDRQVSLSVTKQGGYVVYMLDSREVKGRNIEIAKAVEFAKNFLRRQGFYQMRESYYEENSNTVTVNFAAEQEDVVLYSDLIKVKVALDNGEIVGYEARGYLMSHQARVFPEKILSLDEAQQKVSRHLEVESAGLALIPLESKREVLCYEFKGKYGDNRFLIYMNAETGEEEQIFMLQESDKGTLVV